MHFPAFDVSVPMMSHHPFVQHPNQCSIEKKSAWSEFVYELRLAATQRKSNMKFIDFLLIFSCNPRLLQRLMLEISKRTAEVDVKEQVHVHWDD